MPETALKEQMAYIVASVNRQLEEELQDRLRPAGLPIEQFRILEALVKDGVCSMGELAAYALVEPPTLTKIVDRMVSDALVYRSPDPHDRRRVLILLAPAGKGVYNTLRNVSTAQERRLTKQLSPEKAEELRALLRGLVGP